MHNYEYKTDYLTSLLVNNPPKIDNKEEWTIHKSIVFYHPNEIKNMEDFRDFMKKEIYWSSLTFKESEKEGIYVKKEDITLSEFSNLYSRVIINNGSNDIVLVKSAFYQSEKQDNLDTPLYQQNNFRHAPLPNWFTLPEGITVIQKSAFRWRDIPKSFNKIPDSVTEIEDLAFAYSTIKYPLSFGNNITKLGKFLFSKVEMPVGYSIPPLIDVIGEQTYSEAIFKEGFALHEGVKEISYGAFALATFQKGFRIPSTVEKIGSKAFFGATLPKDFTISKKVKDISPDAFLGCEYI